MRFRFTSIRWKRSSRPRFRQLEIPSSADLTQDAPELVKVHRLAEMEVESGLFAALDIVVAVEPCQGHAFEGLFTFGFRDHIVTAAIRESDVAQNDVEVFCVDHFQRAPLGIGHRDFVAEVT